MIINIYSLPEQDPGFSVEANTNPPAEGDKYNFEKLQK